MGEDSYAPRLEIVQVATDDLIAIVDRRAMPDARSVLWICSPIPEFLRSCMPGGRTSKIFSVEDRRALTPSSIRNWPPRWWDTEHRSAMRNSCSKSSASRWRRQKHSPTGRNGPLTPNRSNMRLKTSPICSRFMPHLIERLEGSRSTGMGRGGIPALTGRLRRRGSRAAVYGMSGYGDGRA